MCKIASFFLKKIDTSYILKPFSKDELTFQTKTTAHR